MLVLTGLCSSSGATRYKESQASPFSSLPSCKSIPSGGLIKGLSSKTATFDSYLASVHLDPALGEELNCLWKDLMLELEDPL